ncbi:MAG: CDP-alcohol phosphatidyltransferase family protein [Actinomycetota bacterium]
MLSFLRLSSVPVFLWLWFADHKDAAVVLYAVGASTDFFDGVIARKTNSVTELGKVLDPLADRVFIVALAVALVGSGALPWLLAVAIVVRDLIVLSLFPVLAKRGVPRLEVNFTGKTATACLLFGLTALALSETDYGWADIGADVGLIFVMAGAILYWVAGALYAREAVRRWKALPGATL